jgi:glycosyltransferase involved in cell wall biosynthesis
MEPFFSIIIPALNEEKAIPHLLHSIEKQTNSDFEVIIVDGGSQDKTPEIAREFASRLNEKQISLHFVRNDAKHIGQQRNKGAEIAKGNYLVCLDADTQIAPNFLEKIQTYVLSHPNEKIMTTTFVADSDKLFDKITTATMNFSIKRSRSDNWPFFLGFDMVFNHEAFKKIGGFNPYLKISEDRELAHRFRLKHEKIGYIHDALLTLSLRRHREEGWFKVTWDLLRSVIDLQLTGKINDSLFDYPMGGQHYTPKNASHK